MLRDNGREWNVNELPLADDTALVADSQEKLRQLEEEFARVCERRKLRINESKSEVIKCAGIVENRRMNVAPN